MQIASDSKRSTVFWIFTFILLLQAAIILYRTRYSYFFTDDFYDFIRYQEYGMTFKYFFRNVFQQLVPGYNFEQGIFFELFGINFVAAKIVIVSLSLLATVFLFLISLRMKVELWLSSAVLLAYASLIQLVHSQSWWSSSTVVFPGLLCSLACLYVLIGPRASGPTSRGQIAAGLIFAAGLLIFTKVLFSIIIFGGFLLYIQINQSVDLFIAIRRVLYELRYLIVAAAAYLVMVYSVLGIQRPELYPSAQLLLEFIGISFFDGTLAATLGLGTYASWAGFWPSIIFASAVFLGIVAVSVRVNGRAVLILWAILLLYIVIVMAVIGVERARLFGTNAATWPRYHVEGATFLLLITMVSLRGFTPHPSVKVAAIVVAVLIGISSEFARKNIPQHWDTVAVRSYVEKLTDSLKQLHMRENLVMKADIVPELIIPKWMAPYNEIRWFLPLFTTKKLVLTDEQHAELALLSDGSIKALKRNSSP